MIYRKGKEEKRGGEKKEEKEREKGERERGEEREVGFCECDGPTTSYMIPSIFKLFPRVVSKLLKCPFPIIHHSPTVLVFLYCHSVTNMHSAKARMVKILIFILILISK